MDIETLIPQVVARALQDSAGALQSAATVGRSSVYALNDDAILEALRASGGRRDANGGSTPPERGPGDSDAAAVPSRASEDAPHPHSDAAAWVRSLF